MWDFVQGNWHKILVVVLAVASAWKYFFEYIRPVAKHDKTVQPINVTLPKEGCVITIKPLKDHSEAEDS